jgi:hypothetical protein
LIIIDFSRLSIAGVIAMLGKHGDKIEEDLGRHFILNTVRNSINKHQAEFGKTDVVIACDAKGSTYWRKNVFPYYKFSRKKMRDDSNIDWGGIFELQKLMKDELREFFPYKVIEVEGAEADDIIGTIVHDQGNTSEKILLVGDDKDFFQLHSYMNFQQYDPVHRKKKIVCPNASLYLREQILRGDSGDDIPNVLSDDDTFAIPGKRQKPLRETKIKEFLGMKPEELPEQVRRNYARNEMLINLENTPQNLKDKILEDYNQQAGKSGNRAKLMNYFMSKRLRNLLEAIGDF